MSGAIDYAKSAQIQAVMLSVNMDKAYDRVEWSYIEEVLKRMQLNPWFRRMVSVLLLNETAEVLINEDVGGNFRLFRLIRQGCPLAPLLYALITEPLMAMFTRETTLGRIKAMPIPGVAQKLTSNCTQMTQTSSAWLRKPHWIMAWRFSRCNVQPHDR